MSTKVKRILKITLLTANILVGILTVMAAYAGLVNPDWFVLPALLAMTFPAWIVLTLLMLIIDLIARRRMAWIPGATLLVCIGPILSIAPMNFSKKPKVLTEGEEMFSFMSFNMFNMNDYQTSKYTRLQQSPPPEAFRDGPDNPTANYVIANPVDILCAQEQHLHYPAPWHKYVRWQVDSVKAIYPHSALCATEAIWSKFPMYPVDLPQPTSGSAAWVAAKVFVGNQTVLVISVHLESFQLQQEDRELVMDVLDGDVKHKMGAMKSQLGSKLAPAFRRRAQQARMLRHQIDSLGIENVILAGDFNDIPDCYAIRTIAGNDFHTAFGEAGRWPVFTYHAEVFLFHIDHILYRGNLRAIDYRLGTCDHSDHYPVFVDFAIKQ